MRIFTVKSEEEEKIYASVASLPRECGNGANARCLGGCGMGHARENHGFEDASAAPTDGAGGRFVGPPVRPANYVEDVDLGVPNFPPPPPYDQGALPHDQGALPIHYVAGARPKVRIGLPPLPELRGDGCSDSE